MDLDLAGTAHRAAELGALAGDAGQPPCAEVRELYTDLRPSGRASSRL